MFSCYIFKNIKPYYCKSHITGILLLFTTSQHGRFQADLSHSMSKPETAHNNVEGQHITNENVTKPLRSKIEPLRPLTSQRSQV